MKPEAPTQAEIERIVSNQDPLIRNLQITQCYHELSQTFTWRTGTAANWCTFATWASKQAGQTIRKEDLKRLFERMLFHSAASLQAAGGLADSLHLESPEQNSRLQKLALDPENYTPAIERASQAVARGNKKVFEEIGWEFARFIADCIDDTTFDEDKINHFCEQLRPGESPEGQGYLRKAFLHYYHSFFEPETSQQAQLILLANIEIGLHEQTRLQPEIAESLDAGLNSLIFMLRVLSGIFRFRGIFKLTNLYLLRWLGRPSALDRALQKLHDAAQNLLRELLTELMMTLTLPSGRSLRLGEDLQTNYPAALQVISNPELSELLRENDPTPDSNIDSGAVDWANLPDRLHYIIDLFRSFQEYQEIHTPPFTNEQVSALKAGILPPGRL